jgi:hypothetical protein
VSTYIKKDIKVQTNIFIKHNVLINRSIVLYVRETPLKRYTQVFKKKYLKLSALIMCGFFLFVFFVKFSSDNISR